MSTAKVKSVIRALNQFEGEKLITVSTSTEIHQFSMIHEYVENEIAFFNAIKRGLSEGGSLILRHLNVEEETEDLYGAVLQDGQFLPLPKETMELAHTTDHRTGERIPKEKGVRFCAF